MQYVRTIAVKKSLRGVLLFPAIVVSISTASIADEFEVTARLRIEGNGQRYSAGIVVPADWSEQKVELLDAQVHNANARVERVGDGCAMLVVRSEPVATGQYAEVVHRYRVRVEPIPPFVARDDFSNEIAKDRSVAEYLKPSPGIESRDEAIKTLADEIAASSPHPWDFAKSAFQWAHKEIQYKEGDFTSAVAAVENRIGDCEEKASVFIALCRARGIPARTVWVPEHCWAEFHLVDRQGTGHWIPAHTSGPPWFGEMKTAKVILQKGDNFRLVQKKAAAARLLGPWIRGALPEPKWEHELQVRHIEEKDKDAGGGDKEKSDGPQNELGSQKQSKYSE